MRRVVIVGGVAGGMSAATRLRRLDPHASITVLERSGHVSYANCGLPYYVGGVIASESDLLLQTPESLERRFRLDVRVSSEVVAIDRAARTVTVVDTADLTEYDLPYDQLVLSPGARPIVPPLPGIERAMTLRTVEDVARIVAAVKRRPRHAVVIGGGFIGVETAENLLARGISTTLVEAADQLLAPLDSEMATVVAHEVRLQGVDLRLGVALAAVGEDSVELTDGESLPADLVILAIGVKPDTTLALECGLVIGDRGGILVDEYWRTSDPAIYAIGDAVAKRDALDGEEVLVPLANIANRQGRVVADHIAGHPVRPVPALGTAIVKVFELSIATTGWNERRLKAAGRPYVAIHSHPNSHAGYYPGAKDMSLKLLVDPESGAILGAQGVGRDGVDKRIDVIATAIRAGLPAVELADLELAYAPPFSSAKDPVNMLGYMADNLLSGATRTAQWHEVADYAAQGIPLIDVRTAAEFAQGHIDGSLNIPIDEMRERIDEVPAGTVLIYCEVGMRGHNATMYLRQNGYDAMNLDGGYRTWVRSPAAVVHTPENRQIGT